MEYTLISLNCCLAIPPLIRLNGTYARAMRLANAVYSTIPFSDIDVLCLQELVFARDTVLKNFIHHPYHSKKIYSSLFGNNIRFLHSGLQIVSKWPILEEDAHVFTGKTYNAEAMMAKAVQYCKILVQKTQIIHVFNTHLQAWTNAKATSIRKEQTRQIGSFMKKKLSLAAPNEPIFYLGDGNSDFYENMDIAQDLLKEVQMYAVLPSTPQFSFDPILNPLVGKDDASEYKIRKNNSNNNKNNNITKIDIFDENKIQSDNNNNNTNSADETRFPRQLIDFFSLAQNQKDITLSKSMSVVPIESEAPFEVLISMNTRLSIQTVSDHFAVLGKATFVPQDSTVVLKPTYQNSYTPQVDLGWLLLQIVLFLIILFLTILFCIFILKCFQHIKNRAHTKKENKTTILM